MMGNNLMIEMMIQVMEIGVVIGITAVVAFTVARQRDEFRTPEPSHTGIAPHAGADPR